MIQIHIWKYIYIHIQKAFRSSYLSSDTRTPNSRALYYPQWFKYISENTYIYIYRKHSAVALSYLSHELPAMIQIHIWKYIYIHIQKAFRSSSLLSLTRTPNSRALYYPQWFKYIYENTYIYIYRKLSAVALCHLSHALQVPSFLFLVLFLTVVHFFRPMGPQPSPPTISIVISHTQSEYRVAKTHRIP